LSNSINSGSQSYNNNGTPSVTTGALLSEFEQQAFSEFLNQLSSTDDFSMLMDTNWFASGPFASTQSNTISSSTTTVNHQINDTNAIKSKSAVNNYSVAPSTPSATTIPMQSLSYTAVSSNNLNQLDLPVSSVLTVPTTTTDPDNNTASLTSSLPSTSWPSAFTNSVSTQEMSAQTIEQSLTSQPLTASTTTNHPMANTENILSSNNSTVNTPTQVTSAYSNSNDTVATTTAVGATKTTTTKHNKAKSSTKSTTTSGGIRKNKHTNNPRPTSPKSTATTNTNANASGPSPSITRTGATLGRPKKPPHESLTESEKKANHIASEQKRRQNIRVGFTSLTSMVPTLSQCSRSEALILQKSVEYIRQLIQRRRDMAARIHELRKQLGEPSIELPGDDEDFMRNMGFSGISGDIDDASINSNHDCTLITNGAAIHAIHDTNGNNPAIATATSTASPLSSSSSPAITTNFS
jgi:hypothetical protein